MDRYIVRYSPLHIVYIFVLQCLYFSTALIIPGLVFQKVILPLFSTDDLLFIISGIVILFSDLYLFLFCIVVTSGITWRIFPLRYQEGIHPLDARVSKDMAKWLLTQTLYRPVQQILVALSMYPLKLLHLRLFGAKIGRNVTIEGMLLDPCMIEIGDNTFIGGYTYIFGHAFELVPGMKDFRATLAKTRIGKNCGLGSGCIVMAGGQMEDESYLAALSIILKKRTLKAGGYYGGVPSKLITVIKKPEDENLFQKTSSQDTTKGKVLNL